MAELKGPAKYSGSFLFVNKDASNLGSRTTKEAFAIGSHVNGRYSKFMRKYRVRQPRSQGDDFSELDASSKANNGRRGDSSPKRTSTNAVSRAIRHIHDGPTDIPKLTLSWRIAQEDSQYRSQDGSSDGNGSISTETVGGTPEAGAVCYKRSAQHLWRQSRSISPLSKSVLAKGNSDPFNSSIRQITPYINHLIKYAASYRATMIWPTEARMNGEPEVLTEWWHSIRDNASEESRYSISLALALAIKAQVNPTERSKLMSQSLTCKCRGIVALREQTSKAPYTISTLMAVLSLYSLGAYNYQSDGPAHLVAARRIIEKLGGVKSLPWMLREYIVTVDVNWAFWALNMPIMTRVSEWDPGSLDEHGQELLNQLKAKTGFYDNGQRWDLHSSIPASPLVEILRNLQEICKVEDAKARLNQVGEFNHLFRWVHMRANACRIRLLTYYLDSILPHLEAIRLNAEGIDQIPSLNLLRNACICIGSIYMVLLMMEHPGTNKKIVFIPQTLQADLDICVDRLRRRMTMEDKELVLWAYSVGAFNHKMHSKSMDSQSSKTTSMRFVWFAKKFGLKSVDEVRDVLQQFLYCDRVLREPLKSLCEGFVERT